MQKNKQMVSVELVECSQVIAIISTPSSRVQQRIYKVLPLPEILKVLGYIRKRKKIAEAANIYGQKERFFFLPNCQEGKEKLGLLCCCKSNCKSSSTVLDKYLVE